MLLADYFKDLEAEISAIPFVFSVETSNNLIDDGIGYFKARITLVDGSTLSVFEFLDLSRQALPLKYRYHFEGKTSGKVLRWDNAPHHPELETFPHHKHEGSKAVPSRQVSLREVLAHVSNFL